MLRIITLLMLIVSIHAYADGLDYLGVYTQAPTLEFDITNIDGSQAIENRIDYLSREPLIVGVFASIHDIGFSISKNLEEEEDKSEYIDLDFSLRGERFSGRLSLSEMEDFYVNSGEGNVDLDQLSESEIENEGVFLRNISLDLMATVINFKLSHKSAFEPAHFPKESGGGVIAILTGDWTYLDGPSFVIPASLQSGFGEDGDLLEGTFQSLNLQIGWAQSLVLGPLYISILAATGPGVSDIRYETETAEVSLNYESQKTSLQGTVGLFTEDFFMGVDIDYRSQDYNLNSISISTLRTSIAINFGLIF